MKYPIAENLKAMRKLIRLSQEEVAERVGVPRQAVAKWEGGETVPPKGNSVQGFWAALRLGPKNRGMSSTFLCLTSPCFRFHSSF